MQLSEEYAADVGSLLIYLGTCLWEAFDDCGGRLSVGLRDRFLDWAMPLRRYSAGERWGQR
ncbi:hypothetical protein [Actinoplanes sp. NPDC051859]|uniref:hypothetical protein n=1 Tax=Actinoplanes sp. NPDC051859 TaxID=3363909 RepID=UPI0037A98208